jgi:mono/diheme cytochrome c family protein
MSQQLSLKATLRRSVWGFAITIGLCGGLTGAALAADSKPDKPAPPNTKEKKPAKTLTGAELYAIHCNRCHPERYATERTTEQWKTILTHMRVRANLPAEQARTIMRFLQEDSGK